MTTYVPAKKGAEFIFYAGLVSQSTGQFQVNPTIAAGDFKVSIDGGALANLATLPAVTPAGSRMVKFTLSTSEMNGDNITVVGVDAAGSEWDEVIVNIQTSVQQIDDLATQASVNTIDDFLDTEIAAIKAKTDNLPTDPADASDIASSFSTVNTKLDTIDDFLDTEITDIRNRLPAALVGGRMDSSVGAMASDVISSTALATSAVDELVDAVWDELKSGHTVADSFGDYLDDEITSRATAADIPSAATIADAVLDEDMTAHQTQGSLGQAIGDPVADTNTIYKAVVTDATGATVGVDVVAVKAETASIQSDTNDIQTRLPAALSGDGFMMADLKSIDDELTSGNNATLNLKRLNIVNNTDNAIHLEASGNNKDVILVEQTNSGGGGGAGLYILSNQALGPSLYLDAEGGADAALIYSVSGDALHLVADDVSRKSINAPDDIAVSDGDLTLTAIANKVLTLDWTTVTGEAARSILNALRKLRNKISFNGTNTLTIYKEDGTTSAYTQSVSTDDTQDPFKELGN